MTPNARYSAAALAVLLLAGGVSEARAQIGKDWEESGQASWYGGKFNGRRTSMGTTYSEHALTAAHDWLPLGTRIKVTTQETGRSTVVVITDRLPPKRLRIIDLSRAAAAQLGIVGAGVGMVTLSNPADEEPVEVAEAPDQDEAADVSPRPRGPRHTHPAARTASARR